MRSTAFAALAASSLLLAVSASDLRAVSAATAPVGFVRQSLEPGLQTVGIALVHAPSLIATVAGNGARELTLAAEESVLDALRRSPAQYYVEVESGDGALVGDRWDLDFMRTRKSAGATLVLAPAAHNTRALPLAADALAGCRISVKRHVTLADAFGGAERPICRSAEEVTQADQVLVHDRERGEFVAYFLLRSAHGAVEGWRRADAPGSQDRTVIPPGAGLFFRRTETSALEWRLTGSVRPHDFVLPLNAGDNFVALPEPIGSAAAAWQRLSSANGFVAADDPARADQILVFNGAGYDAYYLAPDAAAPGGESWRRAPAAAGGTESTAAARSEDIWLARARSVFLRKLAADPDFVAPAGFGG